MVPLAQHHPLIPPPVPVPSLKAQKNNFITVPQMIIPEKLVHQEKS